MANKGAFADFTDDWQMLITNVRENASELPDLTVQLAALEKVLEEVLSMGARQQSRRGDKQQESKELRGKQREGRGIAAKLRAGIKSHLGYTSPLLHKFRIKPLAVKKRRSAGSENPPEEPKPENPAPEPPEVKPAPKTS
jgi:hypothetical protein